MTKVTQNRFPECGLERKIDGNTLAKSLVLPGSVMICALWFCTVPLSHARSEGAFGMFYVGLSRWLAAFLLCWAADLFDPAGAMESITVYTAASTTNAVQDLAAQYEQANGVKVVTSFAGSSALAKQIEQGAPVDVFLSADLKWMDYLAGKGKIVQASRRNLLGNRLVLVAPKARRFRSN
jgi:ABC-type molybdate transport system substrate-binding protein